MRAVLLGASNLRRGLSYVLDLLSRQAGEPAEVLAACGHGRSYGIWSRFLFVRRLPGIEGCGLWRSLAQRSSSPTVALITDVGNDLLYREPVERIAGWVETCLGRLSQAGSTTVLTLLPLKSIERLSALRYHAVASALYPRRPIPWPVMLGKVRQLDERLRRIGQDRGAHLVEPDLSWYGFDPIHFLPSRRRDAWETILAPWAPALRREGGGRGGAAPVWKPPLFGAEDLRLFGIQRRTPQPVCRAGEGSTLELY